MFLFIIYINTLFLLPEIDRRGDDDGSAAVCRPRNDKQRVHQSATTIDGPKEWVVVVDE